MSEVESLHIIIPEAVKETSLMFEVISKGPGCIDDSIQVGNYVYTGKFAPCHIGYPNQRHWYTLNEVDVLGVVTEFDIQEEE